ncbi:MAG: hypothetical protein KDG89_08365 [Geminicoccaceae bacterium]|nr:hypothetical protein [Geminicoccaceae bacterium]
MRSQPKAKAFPFEPRSPRLRGAMQSCAFILAANWVMQGVRGMDEKELSFRLALEAALTLGLALPLAAFLPLGLAVALAFVLAHTLSFTLNGQVWVCCRYCRWYRVDPARIDAWLEATTGRLRRLPWLETALCIGSQGEAAGTRGERSDIDLRLVFPGGASNWLRTNLLLLALRGEAFVRRVPLDLYAYDGVTSLDRFRQSEPLLVILDRKDRLRDHYPRRDLRRAA